MKHFLFEDKEYKINPIYSRPRKDRTLTGLALLWFLRKTVKGKKGSGGSSSGNNRGKTTSCMIDRRQKCVVKVNYSRSIKDHKRQVNEYLAREGAGKSGGTPQLFGSNIEEYKKNMVDKNFRIFLSPQKQGIPLEVLAKTFVKKLELQTGYRFRWVGAEHHNTAHAHAHILINGRDKNGKEVFFSRELIRTIMRDTARDICTSLVGSRTKQDVELEKKEAIASSRFTYLDEQLKKYMSESTVYPDLIKKNRDVYLERLDYLKSLELCRWEDNTYIFVSTWEKDLHTLGRYNTYLDARKRLRYTTAQNMELYDGKTGAKEGVITKIYKTDETSNNHVILLEATDGKAYFVPLLYKPQVKENETVRIVPKTNGKGRLLVSTYKVDERILKERVKTQRRSSGYARHLFNKEFER